MSKIVNIKMLGGFSIEYNGHLIDDSSNRMRKLWLLLAYMICNRSHLISADDYAAVLHSKAGDDPMDLNGNLKALFYRLRTMLDKLGDNAGHQLIIRQNGNYAWNPEYEIILDIENFEKLCDKVNRCDDPANRLALMSAALDLYSGDFIPKLSSEAWAIPVSAYYHRLYLETVEKALSTYKSLGQWDEVAALCQKAIRIEPYSEALYQNLIQCKIASGDKAAAQTIYEDMSELLFSTFGVMPSDESRALYREATKTTADTPVPIGIFRDNLKETGKSDGALFCEYDFFKILYQAHARGIARSGYSIHIALLSVHSKNEKPFTRRSLDMAVSSLKETALENLRQGDIVTQCSISQLILMLPQANYENSCAVCERLLHAFNKQHPRSPTDIHFSVQPLEPFERQPSKDNNI